MDSFVEYLNEYIKNNQTKLQEFGQKDVLIYGNIEKFKRQTGIFEVVFKQYPLPLYRSQVVAKKAKQQTKVESRSGVKMKLNGCLYCVPYKEENENKELIDIISAGDSKRFFEFDINDTFECLSLNDRISICFRKEDLNDKTINLAFAFRVVNLKLVSLLVLNYSCFSNTVNINSFTECWKTYTYAVMNSKYIRRAYIHNIDEKPYDLLVIKCLAHYHTHQYSNKFKIPNETDEEHNFIGIINEKLSVTSKTAGVTLNENVLKLLRQTATSSRFNHEYIIVSIDNLPVVTSLSTYLLWNKRIV